MLKQLPKENFMTKIYKKGIQIMTEQYDQKYEYK